jgi:DNA-binding NtrC family response regulator
MTPEASAFGLRPLPSSALVVEPNSSDMMLIKSALDSAGFTVTGADNFKDAGSLLIETPPSVLVTEIRLGAYNGLQLAYRGKSMKPPMTIVLTSGYRDPVLERDVERIGATFVLKPVTARDFLAAVYRSALRQASSKGTFEPIQPPFERRQTERRQFPTDGLPNDERRGTERRYSVPLASRLSRT